jgi:hypothetical protein
MKTLRKKTNNINHLELRRDIENMNEMGLDGTPEYIAEGKISNEPKTFSIQLENEKGDIYNTYLYESKSEYKQDCKTLNI